MTTKKINVLEIPAGGELDALIAILVHGRPKMELNDDTHCPYCGSEMRFCGTRSWCSPCREWRYSPYREYSGEIESAWTVVEKLKELGCEIMDIWCDYDTDSWWCEITHTGEGVNATAETAPLAICRAALLMINEMKAERK